MRSTIVCLVVLIPSAAGAFPQYQVTPLYGTNSPFDRTRAFTINDDGDIGGSSYDRNTRRVTPVIWRDGVPVQVAPASGADAFVARLNNTGTSVSIVLERIDGDDPDPSKRFNAPVSYITSPSGATTRIPYLPDTNAFYPRDINNTGTLVGSVSGIPSLFPVAGSPVPLPGIGALTAPTNNFGDAGAINNAGHVAGAIEINGGTVNVQMRAFLWRDGTFAFIPSLGGKWTMPADVNESDVVAGLSTLADGSYAAFVWSGGTTTRLDTPAWTTESSAHALNDAGHIVGYARSPEGDRAALWHAGQYHDLNDVIPSGSGWALIHAYDINNAGAIVGIGTLDGRDQAFLLTPIPEPATPATALVVFSVLYQRRRRTSGAMLTVTLPISQPN